MEEKKKIVAHGAFHAQDGTDYFILLCIRIFDLIWFDIYYIEHTHTHTHATHFAIIGEEKKEKVEDWME